MGFISIFMTGIGLSMDAFAVSVAKGMTIKKNQLKMALKISLFFGGFQAIMPMIGWFAGSYFKEYIQAFDHWIAFILLGFIGGKMIYESFKGEDEEADEENELSYKNLTILAIATSIDALAVGISFALFEVSIVWAALIIGITTFILCMFAVLLGKKLGALCQKYAELIGGVILVIIGLKILIEHLFF